MIKVRDYQLVARGGRPIHMATEVVIFERVIKFTEKLSKKQAIAQALAIIKKEVVA